jgi:hypothetical protein
MSIKAYDGKPYNDDFNTSSLEGKNYLRILFKPGLSVQVRELNQLQSMLQSQIDKFGKSVYKEGPILDASTFFTDNANFIDVIIDVGVTGTALLMSNLNLTHGVVLRVSGAGNHEISAEIYAHQVLSTSTNSVRFFIRYNSSGVNAGTATSASTNTDRFASNASLSLAVGTGIALGEVEIITSGSQFGSITKRGYAGRITTDVGVFFARGSFIYNDSVKYTFIEKPNTNDSIADKDFQITGKAVFRLDESAVGALSDTTLYDNAEGTPNTAAPGADRYAITLTPLFLTEQTELTSIANNTSVLASTTSGNELINYLDLLDVDTSQYVASARTEYSQLDSKLAVRTSEESGNYTVRPFKVSVREHLNDAAGNGGRYLSTDPIVGDEAKYITTVEPSVAYVDGYRVPLEETLEIAVDKARTISPAETTFGSANIGNYIEGSTVNVPNFNKPDETYEFKKDNDVSFSPAVTCRIRSIEKKSGSIFKLYIYDLSGDIPRDALTLKGDDAEDTNDTFVFTLSDTDDSAPTPIFDSANNKNIIPLAYNTVQSISKDLTDTGAFESEVVVRGVATGITPTAGSVTLSVNGLTGKTNTAGRFFNDSENAYIVIKESDGSVVAATFTSLGGTNNSNVTLSNCGSTAVTVIAPVKLRLGSGGLTSKTKSLQTRSTGATAAADNMVQITASDTSAAELFEQVQSAGSVTTNTILDLDNYDIIEIDKVVEDDGTVIPSSQYELDNGQRDGLYKVGKIKYTGSTARTGFNVDYKYFTHGTGDFFDVSSYSIPYADIPQYKGDYLSDVLDFRPKDTAGAGTLTLDPNSPTKVTLNYYLSRLDKVVVNSVGDFSVISGEPANDPESPALPANSMGLNNIFVPAYTRSAKDIQLRLIDNRRFTMRDIGRLEKRVENLEYYTSLSLLEREANGKQILDANGERFKNGILVDSFQTQGIADVLDPKLKISFDTRKGELRPQYTLNNNRLRFTGVNGQDDAITSANGNNSTLLSLPYTHEPLVTQDTASIDISVNPYDIATWNGVVELSPASDEWIETEARPVVVYNINGGIDALANSLNESDALVTMSDVWETHSIGKKIDQTTRRLSEAEKAAGGFGGSLPVREITKTFEAVEMREGIKNKAVVNTVETNLGDRVVDVSFIPLIRSRRVYFKAQMLKPNTRVYAFFDNRNVSQFCTKAAFVKHSENSTVDTSTLNAADPFDSDHLNMSRDELVTDDQGDLEGFFVIPKNDTFEFTTGDRRFRLTDSDTNYLANTTTFAQTTYTASGLLQSKEAQIVSTQQIQIQSTEERVQELRPGIVKTTKLEYYDPLAQSFMIGDINTGVYSTKIDLYFRKRSENVPLTVHLVTVENGVPTQKIVPFSKVTKKADDGAGNHEVSISEDATAVTTFEFESPVYLSAGVEYAIVVMSNSPDYRLWMSEVGGTDATTGTRISKNTYMGVSFKSQNASTWTPDQNKDFKMKIHRAKYSNLSGYTYRVDPMLNANGDAIDFSTLRLISQELNFPETSTSYSLRLGSAENHVINPEANKYFGEVKTITAAPSGTGAPAVTPAGTEGAVNITLTSTSDYVSPVIDLDRLSLLSIDNIITDEITVQTTLGKDDAALLTDTELNANHGAATARYITREVELNNAADQLNVIMLANKPSEVTDIRVYVRVKSTDTRIRDVGFTKVEPNAPLLIDSGINFGEAEYLFENTEPFTSFQVKVVFTSEDTAFAPRIKDFRAIATI